LLPSGRGEPSLAGRKERVITLPNESDLGVVTGTGPPHRLDFEQFYAAHFQSLTIQLFAYTSDLSVAQDVVQEAFCRALARWKRIADYDDPAAWVRRVAWNLATSRWRRARTAAQFLRRHREEHAWSPRRWPVRWCRRSRWSGLNWPGCTAVRSTTGTT